VVVAVWIPAEEPRIRRVAARPSAPVATSDGLTLPLGAAHCTVTPETGLPNWSVTSTTRESGSAVPTGALWLSPERAATAWGGAALAVAAKVTTRPDPVPAPTTLAETAWAPAVPPSTQRAPALPSAPVATVSGTT
jgi:hypothetical protein